MVIEKMENLQISYLISGSDILVILFALAAARYWYASSCQKIPENLTIGWGGVGGSVQELGEALREIGRLSAKAAFCAFLAATFQALSFISKLLFT